MMMIRRTQWRIQEMRGEFQLVTLHLLLFLFWHKSHTTQSLCQFLDYSISFSQYSFFKVSWILMFLRTLFWWLVIFTKKFLPSGSNFLASWGFNMKHIQGLILPVINMHCCFIPIYMVYIWYLLLLFWRLACQSKESHWIFFCCRYSLRESSETTKPGEKKIQVLKQKVISCLPLYLCYWQYLLF